VIQVLSLDQPSTELRARGSAVTIGNFDGCHRGHQALLGRTVALARERGMSAVAITFAPRPEAFFQAAKRGGPEALLFTPEQKSRALAEAGIDAQFVVRFDAAFAARTHQDFYRETLLERLGARALVVGDNFRFGNQRAGDATFLAERGRADGLVVEVGVGVTEGRERVSSTRVRTTLTQTGDVASVAAMLGRPYLVEGVVRRGDQRGRTIGFPTANLAVRGAGIVAEQLLPLNGVYAGHLWIADADGGERPTLLTRARRAVPAVANLGVRPTVATGEPLPRLEVHALDAAFGPDELYGKAAGFYFVERLRGEERFASLDELKAQISRDADAARRILSNPGHAERP
jgi:riboflavin kinase/FMN adenylyltransferase